MKSKRFDRLNTGESQLRLPGAPGAVRDVEVSHPRFEQPIQTTRRFEWDMAHRLPFHDGKCRRLHGHRYVADITVAGQVQTEHGSDCGMVMDFGKIDAIIKRLCPWDHMTMLWAEDPLFKKLEKDAKEFGIFSVPYMPTAENLAREMGRILQTRMPVVSVRVYETPKGWAEW